jgi:hypothetical protein
MIEQAIQHGLMLAVLALLASASPLRGWRLFGALFTLGWCVGVLNLMIEAYVFGVLSFEQAAVGLATGAVSFALLAGLAAAGASVLPPSLSPQPWRPTFLRLVGVIAAYEICYIGAGMLVYPYVEHFYADRNLPDFGSLLSLQAARALVFVVGAALLLRSGLRHAPWLIGLAFSIIGGVAPLILTNPFMPADVRFPHMIEVGVSNFVFGAALALLLCKTGRSAAPQPV